MNAALCLVLAAASIAGLIVAGCQTPTLRDSVAEAEQVDVPREMQMVSIPPYRVEPPDILLIELVNNIRPADDPLHAGDELVIRGHKLLLPETKQTVVPAPTPADPNATRTIDEVDQVDAAMKTIDGSFRVQANGTVDLGPVYGGVKVEGLTLTEAQTAILEHLRNEPFSLADPKVAVSMPNVNGKQVVSGEHLVRPDGTILLGVYGQVYVAGYTLDEVKQAVETHLAQFVHDPEVLVDVLAYNSKNIFVITDGGGSGETVAALPFTGNDTVLKAIGQIQGLSEVSSKRMWIARPAPNGTEIAQVMEVDWRAITQDAISTTNYQLFPGDRIYIQADSLISADNFIAKVITPVQRLFGFTILGYSTIGRLQQSPSNAVGGGGGVGGGVF